MALAQKPPSRELRKYLNLHEGKTRCPAAHKQVFAGAGGLFI